MNGITSLAVHTAFAAALLPCLAGAQSASPAPAPAVAQAAPGAASPLVHRRVVVEGTNDEWTNTGIKLASNDLVLLFASGEVKLGDWMGKRDAAGAVARSRDGIEIAEGTLVRKLGTGPAVAVGTKNWFETTAEQQGALKLKVHDKGHQNNAGAFEVQTLVVPSAVLPPPIIVNEDGAPIPEAPVMAARVTVQGTNDEWTTSTIKVEKGDLLVINATGQVNDTSADGIGGERNLSATYALSMKFGTGAPVFAGSHAALVAGEAGLWKFRVNTTSHATAKGAFQVDVLAIRARSLPPAEVVKAE